MQVWRKSIHWFKRYSTYKTMTLKMRSKSPETKHKHVTMIYTQVWRKFIRWFKRYTTSKSMTLKMRSRSPKSKQLLSLSQWSIYASLETIHPLVHKIFHLLKMRSRSPKTKYIISMSQWQIHASLTNIYQLVKEMPHFRGNSTSVNWLFILEIRARSQKYSKLLESSLR